MEKLDVLYTVNDKYLDICLGSILSLIDNVLFSLSTDKKIS